MPDGDSLPPELVAKALRFQDDFEFFARNCLKIRTKEGDIQPLKLNRGQLHLHHRIEAQLKRTGRVRQLIVKGRQMGISTYLQARMYWLLWRAKKGQSLKAFILTHHDSATANLFGMAERFHNLLPEPLRPFTLASNAKELVFADTGCGYSVATAGTREVGRSDTIQLFHGSEVPSWPNAESHVVSLLRTALANAAGTEGYLEATGKGMGNVFHRYAMAALRQQSDWEATFIPWFWDEGYQAECPESYKPTEEFLEYARLHKLHWEQLYWAYLTNRELAQAKSLPPDKICPDFRQEYPATFEEAFQSSGNSFIPALSVLRARKVETDVIGRGPLILGVDPARDVDRVGIVDRCGRRMGERIAETWPPEGNIPYLAQRIAAVIERLRPDLVNIDVGNSGAALCDILNDLGYGYCVHPVNFGSRPLGRGPTGEDLYLNRRAEMYDLMRDWFEDELGVQCPDNDQFQADVCAAEWGPQGCRRNSQNELIIEDKDIIRRRLGASPDLSDGAALTFAVPIYGGMQPQNQPHAPRRKNRRSGY